MSVSIFLSCHAVFTSYVLLIMHQMGLGMLSRNGKPSYLPDVKNGDIPPPLVILYLHSNNLWHELLPRVWLITRGPSFQVAKGRVHRGVKRSIRFEGSGTGPLWASSRSQVMAVAEPPGLSGARLVHDCTQAVQSAELTHDVQI